jgi:hypothetical protein
MVRTTSDGLGHAGAPECRSPAAFSSVEVGGHFSSCPLGANQPLQAGDYGHPKNVPGSKRRPSNLPKTRFRPRWSDLCFRGQDVSDQVMITRSTLIA